AAGDRVHGERNATTSVGSFWCGALREDGAEFHARETQGGLYEETRGSRCRWGRLGGGDRRYGRLGAGTRPSALLQGRIVGKVPDWNNNTHYYCPATLAHPEGDRPSLAARRFTEVMVVHIKQQAGAAISAALSVGAPVADREPFRSRRSTQLGR